MSYSACQLGPTGHASSSSLKPHQSNTSTSPGLLTARPRHLPSLKPIGYSWSYLACRIGHFIPIWQPCIGSLIQQCAIVRRGIDACRIGNSIPIWQPCIGSLIKQRAIVSRGLDACRIGHFIPIWQPCLGSLIQQCAIVHRGLDACISAGQQCVQDNRNALYF
jgi:hypothetical protein